MMEQKSKHHYTVQCLAQKLHSLCEASYEYGSPWQVEQFVEDLHNPQSEYIILQDQVIVGFLGYHQFLDEVEIFNLVVRKECKNQGIGQQLLNLLNDSALEESVNQILLEVRVSNTSAQSFYVKNGFDLLGRRKGYYSFPDEDALIMKKKVRPFEAK